MPLGGSSKPPYWPSHGPSSDRRGSPAFAALESAYRALRDAHITPRKPKGGKRRKRKDPTLQTWSDQEGAFHTRFWGHQIEGRRNFQGVDPQVARYMRAYQALWNAWYPHTPHGIASIKRSKKKSNAKQAERPEAKATKAAYAKTGGGRAALGRSQRTRQLKAKIAKGMAEQALYDSWNDDEASGRRLPTSSETSP
jgi:hypothetical protein